jgi:hypothetical protein
MAVIVLPIHLFVSTSIDADTEGTMCLLLHGPCGGHDLYCFWYVFDQYGLPHLMLDHLVMFFINTVLPMFHIFCFHCLFLLHHMEFFGVADEANFNSGSYTVHLIRYELSFM